MTGIPTPALSLFLEEGKLAKWLVKEGDIVMPGDAADQTVSSFGRCST